ncbi:MAG: hypothetical protein RLZZ50_1508 [Verrucomicrobiota bacterium]|jgi:hypothetical protein
MSEPAALPPVRTIAAWRVLLRGAGVLLALFTFCFWAAKGYHRGWTQNQVPVKQVDPVTELEFVTYEKRFVPGLDYLGGGILVGTLLFGATFVGRRSPTPPSA